MLYLHYPCKKVVEELDQENLKVIKNTVPNKLRNTEKQLESSITNVHIVGENLLRAFYKLFQVISEKTVQKRFYKEFERDFQIVIVVIIIPTNLVMNFLLSFFFFSQKPETRIKTSGRWWSGNEIYFCFLVKVSCALLQRYAEFNRLL